MKNLRQVGFLLQHGNLTRSAIAKKTGTPKNAVFAIEKIQNNQRKVRSSWLQQIRKGEK